MYSWEEDMNAHNQFVVPRWEVCGFIIGPRFSRLTACSNRKTTRFLESHNFSWETNGKEW